MITADDLRKFSRGMRQEYVDAILSGLEHMQEAGILENERRIAHFFGQFGAETDGGRIIRESLTYTTVSRLRTVWPARFKNKPDSYLKTLLRNPVALGEAVYGGRMGNREYGDGYNYRGGGIIQTTGRSAVEEYCAKCSIKPSPTILDDCNATLKFACFEWKESGCNQWADENDIVKVSKAINTGSATSKVAPVGLNDRKIWFAKAWSVWGDKGRPDAVEKPQTATPVSNDVIKVGSGLTAYSLITNPPDLTPLTQWQTSGQTLLSAGTFAVSNWKIMVGVLIVAAAIYLLPRLERAIR